MDFEQFKKEFEIFTKIDSPEKLAICEKQYQRHLLQIEDEKYFEPSEKHEGTSILAKYDRDINEIFGLDRIKENEFYILVQPSFKPENLLIVSHDKENFSLTHVELSASHWEKVYTNSTKKLDQIVNNTTLDTNTGAFLVELLRKTINSAKVPKSPFMVLDGIKHFLIGNIGGEVKIVAKLSPRENSYSGRIVSLLDLLVEYTKNQNPGLNKKISSLTHELLNGA